MISGTLITGGIMISYWMNYGFHFLTSEIWWSIRIAAQSFFIIVVMVGLPFLSYSARWLILRSRVDEARGVTTGIFSKPEDYHKVKEEMDQFVQSPRSQNSGGGLRMCAMLINGLSQNFSRTLLGTAAQFFQQIYGFNLITYHATLVLENSLSFGPWMGRLLVSVNNATYFLASLVALRLINHAGRRKLMLLARSG